MPTTRPASRRSPKTTPVGGTTSRARGPIAAPRPPAKGGPKPAAPTPAAGKAPRAKPAPAKAARAQSTAAKPAPTLTKGRASRPSRAVAKSAPPAPAPKRSAVLAAVVPTSTRSRQPAVVVKATVSGTKRSRLTEPAMSRAVPAKVAAVKVAAKRVVVERVSTKRGPVGRAKVAPTKAGATRAVRGGAAPAMRLVRIKALDPCTRCGPNTSVEQLYRVDEQVAGTATVHLVFFDRHGWYCVHGASCVAVRDVHAELKAQRAGRGRS